MTIKDARQLYFDSAQYWLHHVKRADTQTIEDVLALMDHKDGRANIVWAKHFGREQLFTSAIMQANITLARLKIQ